MRRRYKSINDIEAQLKRIDGLSQDRRYWLNRFGVRRLQDATATARKYKQNIVRRITPMGFYGRPDDPVWDKKVTNRVYMGLSKG